MFNEFKSVLLFLNIHLTFLLMLTKYLNEIEAVFHIFQHCFICTVCACLVCHDIFMVKSVAIVVSASVV